MKIISTQELQYITGGRCTYAIAPDADLLATIGGMTNHNILSMHGVDITGDNLFYNQILGTIALVSMAVPLSVAIFVATPGFGLGMTFGAIGLCWYSYSSCPVR
ncbi:MAG: hypothetical protein JSS07_06635 [Proteobacteria bacterium]|nr:hypothetical protein [Pseudomonadota bacterium]